MFKLRHIGGKQMSENRTGLEARLRDMRALSLVMSAEEAAELVKDGMTV